jgi:hypothetical protein
MSTSPRIPLAWGAITLALALALALAGCGGNPTPVTKVGLSRDTPEKTYDYFKTMVANNQHAAEWAVFSPNAKRQADQLAGKHVDIGDYNMARSTPLANNSQSDMQALLNSSLVGVQMQGPDMAMVTIAGGGRQVSVRMARLTTWELRVAGEDTPYSDFVRSAADAVSTNPDGSITVRIPPSASMAGVIRTIPRERIDGFAVKAQWYIDDLSSLQGAVQATGQSAPQSGGAPAPGTPAPRSTAPVAPAATGSPD